MLMKRLSTWSQRLWLLIVVVGFDLPESKRENVELGLRSVRTCQYMILRKEFRYSVQFLRNKLNKQNVGWIAITTRSTEPVQDSRRLSSFGFVCRFVRNHFNHNSVYCRKETKQSPREAVRYWRFLLSIVPSSSLSYAPSLFRLIF